MLTIAISVSAGASAIIAYFPALAPWRLIIALALVVIVAGISWFGHIVFALMALSFVGVAVIVLLFGLGAEPLNAVAPSPTTPPGGAVLAVIFAFPVAMALATGVEAPSSAIAQLGGLDDRRRRLFGQITLWLTLGIVGTITMGLAIEASTLGIGLPGAESTLIAELARYVAPEPVFAAFQLVTALLLLAAASSSFQAGPGLLKALARAGTGPGDDTGIVPQAFSRTNAAHTPYWGVVLFAVLSMGVVAIAGGSDQSLVLFYAVAVFLSFLSGLAAMTVFARRERRWRSLALNAVGTAVVAFTLVVNLGRIYPIVSLVAALAVGGVLFALWVRAGRPEGIRSLEAQAEADIEQL